MPKLQAELGDVTPHLQSQQVVQPIDYASLFKQGAALAKGVYEYAGQQAMEGREGDTAKGTAGIGEARIKLGDEFSVEDLDNLQKIKRAREQGIISATDARMRTGQLVKEMGARWPGMEDTFKRQADQFFGKFGEGDLLLDDSKEKAARKLFETKFLAPGIEAGIINAYDPEGDLQGQQAWSKMVTDATIRKQKLDVLEADYKLGNASAMDVGSAYVASEVDSDIAYFLNQQTQRLEKGEKGLNDQELKGIIDAKIVQQRLALNQKLQGKRVDPATRKALMDEIDARWSGVTKMVDSNSFSTFLKGKGEMLRNWGTVYGASKYPEMFALEQAMPGGGSVMLKNAEIFARLKTPAQREEFIKTQPPMTQRILRSLGENPTDIVPLIDDLINGKTTTGIEGLDSVTLGLTRDYASTPATTVDPKEVEQKKKAAEAVLMYDTPKNVMNMATAPGAIPTFYNDKQMLGQLQATVDHTYASVLPALHNEFVGRKRVGRVGRGIKGTYVPEAQFVVTLEGNNFVFTEAESGKSTIKVGRSRTQTRSIFPTEVKEQIDRLNQINKIVNIYGPVLGIKPDQWRRDTVAYIMGGPEAKQQQQAQRAMPQPGDIVDGYKYIGPVDGNRKDQANWEKQ